MRRLLAACLFVIFAFLAVSDTFACPDGCQCASSRAAAARCDATGACVFCTAAALTSSNALTSVHFVAADVIADLPQLANSLPPIDPPDHPPRFV